MGSPVNWDKTNVRKLKGHVRAYECTCSLVGDLLYVPQMHLHPAQDRGLYSSWQMPARKYNDCTIHTIHRS